MEKKKFNWNNFFGKGASILSGIRVCKLCNKKAASLKIERLGFPPTITCFSCGQRLINTAKENGIQLNVSRISNGSR